MEKEELISNRTKFFQNIINHLDSPPSRIDEILNQDIYYIKPDLNKLLFNPNSGDMVIPIDGEFHNKKFNIFYSFWQVGYTLKIGVALNEVDLQGAFASDTHEEVYDLWGVSNKPKIDVARGCVFYDWEFDVTNLYDSYRDQEKFILGVKHMHFRVMRVICAECHKLWLDSTQS